MHNSKTVTFLFQLEGKGKIWNVKFYPEKDLDFDLPFKASADFKTWKTDKFDFDVVDPFDFKLVVGARTGTDWEAVLKIVDGANEKEFLKLKGTTGESGRNKSVITKPSVPLN